MLRISFVYSWGMEYVRNAKRPGPNASKDYPLKLSKNLGKTSNLGNVWQAHSTEESEDLLTELRNQFLWMNPKVMVKWEIILSDTICAYIGTSQERYFLFWMLSFFITFRSSSYNGIDEQGEKSQKE